MKYSLLRKNGFTLIELVIVMAIISILMIALFSLINPVEQIKKANDAAKESSAHELVSVLAHYSVDKGYLPWNANPAISGCNPIVSADQNNMSILGTTLSAASSCVQAVMNAGYLNQQFLDNADIANNIFISQESGSSRTVACFKPESQATRQNQYAIYSPTGYKQSSGCIAQGGVTECYWCIR